MVDTSSINKPKVDKHSTGGVGDKVSLILAPLVASCGVAVPMISGRGLGITGGTLDKMESIPGYRTDLTEERFVEVVRECGCSIIGQTDRIAPADKKLYALRDVTATVPSIPLIVASIMSKKLAEGIDALVLDVKWGQGAFMKTYEQAEELARNLVEVGSRMNTSVSAIISDMNQPLGLTAGNALEVLESIECLRGEGPEDLMEITMALSARMLIQSGLVDDSVSAFELLQSRIQAGEAIRVFRHMIELQGGDPSCIDDPTALKASGMTQNLISPRSGFISGVDANSIGRAALLLGAGRQKTSDQVDHAVGISRLIKIGDPVEKGQPLCCVHSQSEADFSKASEELQQAFTVADTVEPTQSIVRDTVLPENR
jgi:pyrimidine-nucleoside phosphorylase